MPFGITPEDPTGTPAEPENTTSFAVTPVIAPVAPIPGTPSTFLQWQAGGYDLGLPDVLVVNFRYPLVATRGVGEHENIITVRRASPPGSSDMMSMSVPAILSGELIVPPSLFYTSILYPLFTQDNMSVSVALSHGWLLTIGVDPMSTPVPSIQSGTLVPTIAFITYDARPFPDNSQVFVPAVQSGTLVVTIEYLVYDARPFPDNSQVFVPAIQSGTLVVTIEYVIYDNSVTFPDPMQVFVPAIQSGTLT